MLAYLWDPNRDFFYHVIKDNVAQGYDDPSTGKAYPPGTKLNGREVFGYYPWQFGVVPDQPQYAAAWKQLLNPAGFGTRYGPSTAEVRNSFTDTTGEYAPDIENGNCCRWDGPAWPYTHARTLQALANVLDDYQNRTAPGDRAPAATCSTYLTSLAKFAALERKNGQPYTAEAADAVTGKWIYDTNGRSNANNQYPVDDAFVTGLIGIRPALGETLDVKPLTAPDWRWWAMENVPYHGHLLKVVYDRSGDHYHVGRGLSVYVDGRLVAHRDDLGSLRVDVGASTTPTVPAYSTASRYDGSRTNWAGQNGLYPKYSASFTPNDDRAWPGPSTAPPCSTRNCPTRRSTPPVRPPQRLVRRRLRHQPPGGRDPGGGLRRRSVRRAHLAVGPAVERQRLDRFPGVTQKPAKPRADEISDFRFPTVRTQKIRVRTGENHQAEAISEIEAWGPADTNPVNCPSATDLGPNARHYEAENGVTNLGNAGVQAPNACGWGVVGGLNTTQNYFVKDFSLVKPGDFSATTTGPLWQGFTGTSWVDFFVDAPSSGSYVAQLRYTNGISGTDAVEEVSVDGRAIGTIRLSPTGGFSLVDGAIKPYDATISLTKGRHRIRIAVASGYAEFDSLDLAPKG